MFFAQKQSRQLARKLVKWYGLICLISSTAFAQGVDSNQVWNAQVEVGGWVATTKTQPFWLQANQYGTASRSTPAITLRAALWKGYARPDSSRKRRQRFDWAVGIRPVLNASAQSQVLLGEAYVKGKLGWLELSAGRWRQLIGIGDSTLSSGFIATSDNALPLPKVQLSTPGYVSLGFLKNWVAINAGYSHGWFNVPYIQRSFLHQKYFYMQFGKPASRFKFSLGANHEVQWAGQADYLVGSLIAVNGKLPSQIKYYPDVVLGRRPKEWQNDDYTSFDGAYWIGNGLGSIDMSAKLTNQYGVWFLYHQHIYEDLSGLLFVNVPDGLTGLSWTRASRTTSGLQRVVVEYLGTTNQSGSTFNLTGRYQGADNYYNHGQYREGWSYLGRSLGTPFIAPGSSLQPSAQGGLFFPNNRIRALYVGLSGVLSNRINWTSRLTYSQNEGTFFQPYSSRLNQFSGLVTAQTPLSRWPGTYLTTSSAYDGGRLLPAVLGGYISLTKRW